nr:RHS repeat-associated core domain-containing protein [Bordetella sp. LUAb4]
MASNQANGIWNILDTRYLPGLELRGNSASGENLEVIVLDDGARVLNWAGDAGKPNDIPNLQLRFQYADRQNSCQLEADSDGNVITQEEYYPYGGTAVLTSRSNSEVKYKTIRYSGKERDATGLYYHGLRYYQPWIARWINPDPAGTADGLNLYRMVKNNPATLLDTTGLKAGEGMNEASEEDTASAVAHGPPAELPRREPATAVRPTEKLARIPKKLHYVWLGGTMPANNLRNVLLAAHQNPDYKVNVWTDRPMAIHAAQEQSQYEADSSLHRHLQYRYGHRLEVRDVAEPFEALQQRFRSTGTLSSGEARHGLGTHLHALFLGAKNGSYRNFAGGSDIARLAILAAEGGVYADVDVVFKDPLGEQRTRRGLKTIEVTRKSISNAVFGAPAHSPQVLRLLETIPEQIALYEKWELPVPSKFADNQFGPKFLWQKRAIVTKSPSDFHNRLYGTMFTTGPGLLVANGLHLSNDAPDFFPWEALGTISGERYITPESPHEAAMMLRLIAESPPISREEAITCGWEPGVNAGGAWSAVRSGRRSSM